MNSKQLASMIDHTLLKPEAGVEDIRRLCAEAREYGFASVCVNGSFVETAVRETKGSGVKVCTVIGFPLGACSSETKAFEAREAVARGAEELDMVVAVGRLRTGDEDYVREDIRKVVDAAGKGAVVKVILETCLLDDEKKILGCRPAEEGGARFVKTSTGFSSGGATAEDVALMRRTVGDRLGVKAAGGIRTRHDAETMIAAGANRIGASASSAICSEARS
ncbi:deoxyribose-phosphate aldolase [Aminivibrio sp.]|jgi:deoxyribose-phosphate aldolase|uniref:deoxyribose-phosphate aldolase n=1 Tax=Aminivibrio sp. TaxID=1872489 RepID=UPI001A3827C5|nr:deoxyribose-phosphate aldolase [Aminivibrio sp.]MBL3539433.1 deoxyribose-phosphate aldolase [Aminivibrio sp.]MDK2957997.1 deoxyribose-phosphate aldolase [Synergistaceae bacterium]